MTEFTLGSGEHSSRFENNDLPIPQSDQSASTSPIVLLDYLDRMVMENEVGHREYLKQVLLQAAEIAAMLNVDSEAWLLFIEDPRWEDIRRRPTEADRDDALRYVLRWLLDRRPSGSKLANKYYRAVKNVLNTGAPLSEIPAFIDRNGIEELAYPKNGAKVSSSRANKRLEAIIEGRGKPIFILATRGKSTGLPTSVYPVCLKGYWIDDGPDLGRFLVYEVDDQSFALVTPAPVPEGK